MFIIRYIFLSVFIIAANCWLGHRFHIIAKNCPYRLTTCSMVDEKSLLDQMKETLGDKEDVLDDAMKESSRTLLQGLREFDKDPNVKINNKLIEWLGENGVWVKQESAWGRAPHPLVISSDTEDDGESCGRGLLARESLSEGEIMMIIPMDLCLTKSMAQELLGTIIIPDYMDEYIAIAILLMTERIKGAESKWKPYVDILPTIQDVYPSFIWNEEELEMLRGSPTYAASLSLRFVDFKRIALNPWPDIVYSPCTFSHPLYLENMQSFNA